MMQFYRNAILFGTPSQALRALYCALRCRSITHTEYYELLKIHEETVIATGKVSRLEAAIKTAVFREEKRNGISISSNPNRTHSGIS